MRTYENPSRTFTRPYSAKTVYFYKEGDLFFTGIRLPISRHRYKNIHNLMDELNHSMYLPFGVRNITTPMGRTNISDLDQLQHLGRYVASSSNPPKGVDLDKIQEKYSATQRREPQRTTAGGHSYWMPTTPTLPNRVNASRILRALNLISAKQVFFVLNGKGKFYRSLINPMKMPSMEQLLEECSSHLEVAIHRLYTPEGKLITTVEEILAYDGPRIIACPRNERPLVHEKSGSNTVKLPEIHPTRYAPRQPYQKTVSDAKTSTGGSGGAGTSGSSSGNSIEKRLPALNHRYQQKRIQENGVSHNSPTSYVPKSYTIKPKKPIPSRTNHVSNRPNMERSRNATARQSTEASSAASTAPKDSGTGTSINSQQSDRPASMTEKKAQMIRDELRANLRKHTQQNSSSEQYSEEDMIREEESDYDHIGAGGIQSGTSDEENETTNKLGKRKKSFRKSNGSSNRTPAHMTPSTAGSGKSARGSAEKRLKTMSRQDTPYHETPSRQNTGDAASTSSEPRSTLSSRTSTASKAIQELSDDEEEKQNMNVDKERLQEEDDDSEEEDTDDDDDDSSRNTPAIHTPDTRQPTAKSRLSNAGSVRSFDSDSSRAWSRISGYSDKEVILPSDEEEDPYLAYRDIGTAERERLGEAATKIQKAYKKYNEKKKKVQFEKEKEEQEEREKREYEEKQQQYKIEIVIGNRFGADFDTPLFVVLHGENGSSEKMYSRQSSWLFSILDFYMNNEGAEDEDMNEGRQVKNNQIEICITRTIMGLGQLTSIDVGHEREGYGAGTFIDKIFVTEEGKTTGRRFYFQVEKWFDSAQTDGLLERNIKLNGLLYLEAPIVRKKSSKGRWEFRLHSMQSDLGGTTSNIILYGYGMNDYVAYYIKNDSLLRDPNSVSLIQIDFGTDMGTLRKVRIEIDGAGDKPNYYLEYVEAQDLDTKERCVIMVHNWLLVEANHGHKKWQSFREFPILSKTYDPMPARTYEGTVTLADKSLTISDETPIYLQCFSEAVEENDIALDSSGQFPIVPTKMKNGNIHFTYKVDVVTNGHYPRLRIIPQNTKLGHDLLDGMSLLEEIYDDMISHVQIDRDVFRVGQELFIEDIQLKCGEHFPHFMHYTKYNFDFERNHKDGPFFKQMLPLNPSSTSTDRKWKKSEARPVEEISHWELLMSVSFEYGRVDTPRVVLVANDNRTFEMEYLTGASEHDEDNDFLRYTLSVPNFGNPLKCRVSLEETTPGISTRVIKMILNEVNTKTQVFFKVNKELLDYDTEEMPCIYPDVGVYPMKEYEVHITTLEGGGNFRPYINILGDNGDTGYRAFPGERNMNSNPVSELILSAVDLRILRNIEVWAKTGEPESWKGSIKIVENNTLEYESGQLELSMNGQIAYSPLEFKRAIESLGSGEESYESGEAEI